MVLNRPALAGVKKHNSPSARESMKILIAPDKFKGVSTAQEIAQMLRNQVQKHRPQALLRLYDDYCIPKKCLNCNIGTYLLNYHHNDPKDPALF